MADRFHLFQNLLEYLKDIFKEEIPNKIFIKNGEILDKATNKILKEKFQLFNNNWLFSNTVSEAMDKKLNTSFLTSKTESLMESSKLITN